MGDEFDPYLRWLGIRDEERPPNHYALLGVELFEFDPEVLANAADRQMAHVRTFQSGKHSAESQRLLNELASAKICLLDPAKKAEYDVQLRERRRAAELAAIATTHPRSDTFAARPRTTRGAPTVTLAIVILMALALTGLAVVAVKITSRPAEPVIPPRTPPRVARTPVEPPQWSPTADTSPPAAEPIWRAPRQTPSPRERWERRPERRERARPRFVAPPIAPQPVAPPEEAPEGSTEEEASGQPLNEPAERPEPASRPTKPALPDKAAREAARKTVRREFNDKYQVAKDANGLRALGFFLFHQAGRTGHDDATRYVLLEESATAAILSGSDNGSLRMAAAKISEEFDVSSDEALIELFRHVAEQPMMPAMSVTVVASMVSRIEEDMRSERFEPAGNLAEVAQELARRSKNAAVVKHVANVRKELDRYQESHAAFVAAGETLAASPDDPKANRMRGFYYCFFRNDWTSGRQHLIKGDRSRLKRLAEADEKAARRQSEALAAGDAWWDAVASAEPALREAYRRRAEHWYRETLDGLAGAEKVRVKQRLEMSKGRR